MPTAVEQLSPEGHQLMTRLLSELETMRKYQKSFFNGNKGAMKAAMYWENQVDNTRILAKQRFGIELAESKGQASQGKLI